jgi:hypothetical protein
MNNPKYKLTQQVILVIGIVLLAVFLIPTPGTGNMDTWVRWIDEANDLGLLKDYSLNHDTYPPLTLVILFGVGKLSAWLNIWIYTAIKATIAAFLLLTTLVTLWATKDLLLSLLLLGGLLINSVALGHLDIFFAPTLVLALWALKEKRLVLFTIAFCLSFLTKWQPLIIAPFITLYILGIDRLRDWKQINLRAILKKILAPAAVILALTFVVFGFKPVLAAFTNASDHHFLSGNALNLNWIITHFLHVFNPVQYGPLVNGQAQLILGPPESVKLVPRLLFFAVFALTVVVFFKREKTFGSLVWFSLLGYWAYITFNTGVHENHWFVAIILAALLYWAEKQHLYTMLTMMLIGNLNLLVFNGLDGADNQFSRVISGVDMALVIAVFNVLVFLIYWVFGVWLRKRASVESSQLPDSNFQ